MSRRKAGPVDPRLLRRVPALRTHVVVLTALQVLGALLTVAWAGTLATAVAHVVVDHAGRHTLGPDLLAVASCGVARAVVAAAVEWTGRRASLRVRAGVRELAVRAVSRAGAGWADAQPAGRVANAVGAAPEALDGWTTRALPALVAAAVVPPVVAVRIALVDGWSALVLVGLLPLVPLFMALVGVSTRERLTRRQAVLAQLSGRFLDVVQGLATLRVYGRADEQVARLRRAADAYRRHTVGALRVGFLSGLVLDLLATLSIAVVAVEIGLRLDAGSLGLATALTVLLLAPELFAPLRAAGVQYHAAEEGRAAVAAVLDLVTEAEAAPVPSRPAHLGAAGSVSWRGVTVHRPGREHPAVAAVDLDVAPGTVVVLEGPSGGGKTTLLGTALGLVAPDAGRVVLGVGDDEPAWVPQRPRPTRSTVGAEVALGDPTATPGEVDDVLAACAAPAADTPLGDRGAAVSAGQRRRVALARALLRARGVLAAGGIPLLLLDEPSEDLDAVTEGVVVDLVDALRGRATLVVATHSPALAAVADRRVRIADGRVASDRSVTPSPRPWRSPLPTGPVSAGRGAVRSFGAEPAPPVTTSALLRALPDRGRLALAGLTSGAAGLAGLALTATSLWLIGRAAGHPGVEALALAVVGVRTFALARALLRYAERLVGHDVALRLVGDLREATVGRLARLVPYGLGTARRGDVLRTYVTDLDTVQDGLIRTAIPWTGALVTATGATVLAGALLPAAGAAMAVLSGCSLVAAPLLARRVGGAGDAAAALAAERDASALTLVEGLAELSVHDAVQPALDRLAELERRHTRAAARSRRAATIGVLAQGLTFGVGLPVVVGVSAAASARGDAPVLTVAALVACVLALADATAPVVSATASWSGVLAAWRRATQLVARPASVPEPLHPASVPTGRLTVTAQALAVAPGPDAAAVLAHVDLVLRPGHTVAVTGPSGCGKSTLLSTVLRLTPARRGHVDLSDTTTRADLATVASADLPPRVGGSLQGDHVFDASIGDNLRIVRPDADDVDLARVCERAGLGPFVRALPQGWDTAAGPDGAALSGGQRQRLLLARAFLADPDVLVLDEPTAHLDRETADAVVRDLLDATAGRTVLLSSHRPLPDTAAVTLLDLRPEPGRARASVFGEAWSTGQLAKYTVATD